MASEANRGDDIVRAAGGVVWRRDDGGRIEVVLIHRDRYDDWTLPKGKQDPGETDEETALREVEEETGLTCRLGPELPSVSYLDTKSRQKFVRYWSMTVVAERDRPPDDEVDDVRWVSRKTAKRMLTYQHDREVLHALREVLRNG